MSNLTPDELARLRLKAKHGMLTPEEQQAYDDYATEQLSAVSSPPSGAVPPKKGFKWESEKVAEWRLKARHDGLDENERLLYQDYQQTLALAEADANASDAKFTGGVIGEAAEEERDSARRHVAGARGPDWDVRHDGMQAVGIAFPGSVHDVRNQLQVDG